MRPPKGFENEKFPLRHRLEYGCALSLGADTLNTVFMPIVRFASATAAGALTDPGTIQVNPHNSALEEDSGSLCGRMSIIDRMTISLKFTMLRACSPAALTSGTAGPNFDDGVYTGDDIPAFNFKWRPIFNVYPEKMDAVDDNTAQTVAAILGMTKDPTNEDVVPVTTTNLIETGQSNTSHPISSVNQTEALADFNMTGDLLMEDHVFVEDTLQTALRRYTNKGALRSCLGRTRNVTLSRSRPFKNFYIDKFVPRAIRRIQPYALFGIQVHLPLDEDIDQHFYTSTATPTSGHLGIKLLANYHEWNFEHDQDRGTPT